MEHNLGVCKPDIALLNDEGKVVSVIEIVVTHDPEDYAVQYYKENNIYLAIVKLENDDSFELLEKSPFPLNLNGCTNPKCKRCKSSYTTKKHFMIMDLRCWKCKSVMKTVVAHTKGRSFDHFDEDDIKKAKEFGILLRKQYSATAKENYIANICKKCGAMSGRYFLRDDYHNAQSGYISCEVVDAGFYCPQCD
jgi:hypothetical protein